VIWTTLGPVSSSWDPAAAASNEWAFGMYVLPVYVVEGYIAEGSIISVTSTWSALAPATSAWI
jgi:hypothetical protein